MTSKSPAICEICHTAGDMRGACVNCNRVMCAECQSETEPMDCGECGSAAVRSDDLLDSTQKGATMTGELRCIPSRRQHSMFEGRCMYCSLTARRKLELERQEIKRKEKERSNERKRRLRSNT